MAEIALDVTWICVAVAALFYVVGLPPISYWRRCRKCPTCKGIGWLRTDRAARGSHD